MTSATNLGNQATFNNDQLTTNLGVFTNPSGEILFWNGSQDLGKLYTYNFSFTLAKGYKSQAAKRRDSWERTGRKPDGKLATVPNYPLGTLICDNM